MCYSKNKLLNTKVVIIIAICIIISGLYNLDLPQNSYTAIASHTSSLENIDAYNEIVIYKGSEGNNRARSSTILNLQLLILVLISLYKIQLKTSSVKHVDKKPFLEKLYALLSPKQNTGRFKIKSLSLL